MPPHSAGSAPGRPSPPAPPVASSRASASVASLQLDDRSLHSTVSIPAQGQPTQAAPGSAAKIEVLTARAKRGESLFHPDDNRAAVGAQQHVNAGDRRCGRPRKDLPAGVYWMGKRRRYAAVVQWRGKRKRVAWCRTIEDAVRAIAEWKRNHPPPGEGEGERGQPRGSSQGKENASHAPLPPPTSPATRVAPHCFADRAKDSAATTTLLQDPNTGQPRPADLPAIDPATGATLGTSGKG